jgi:hypothetical protein
MFIINTLATIYQTPFVCGYIDINADIKQQKEKLSATLCGICKKENPLQYSIELYKQMNEDSEIGFNCVSFKIPKQIIIVDTDDEQSEERVRNILNKQYSESEVENNSFPSISRALGINMKKGYHYYFMRGADLLFEKQKEQYKAGITGDMDILASGGATAGFVIEHIDSELPSEGRVLVINNELLNKICDKKQISNKMKTDSDLSGEETSEYIDEIDEEYRNIEVWKKWVELMPNPDGLTRQQWLTVAKFFKKYFPNEGFELFTIWSEKWAGYNSKNDLVMWNSSIDNNAVKVGSMIYLMKEYSIDAYKEWSEIIKTKKQVKTVFGTSEEEVSEMAYKLLKNSFVYVDRQYYAKNKNIWSNNSTQFNALLKNSIVDLKIKMRIESNIKGEIIYNFVIYCNTVKHLNAILSRVMDKITANPCDEMSVLFFKSTLGRLCFNDGVYNFRTKCFSLWDSEELKQNPIYSCVKVNRNFPLKNAISEEQKQEIINKIFYSSMGRDNADKLIQFFSRAVAGEIQDKQYCSLVFSRDSSKGVINDWFEYTFGAYVGQAESCNFLIKESSTDSDKDNGWLIPFQYTRFQFVSEFPTDFKNKKMQVNSKLIKSINSGGDTIRGRYLFKDAISFKVQCRTVFMCNDMPPYSTSDVCEKCLDISSSIQYKTKYEIDNELEKVKDNKIIYNAINNTWKLKDPELRNTVKTDLYADALIRILIDNYKDIEVFIDKKQLINDGDDAGILQKITDAFTITERETDFISNNDLKDFASENGVSLKKLKDNIKMLSSKILEGKDNTAKRNRGLTGIKLSDTS